MNYKIAFFAAFIAIASACSNTPHDHEAEGHNHDAEVEAALKPDKANLVVMSAYAVENAGIISQPVSKSEFRDAVKTAGIIENCRGDERIIAAPAAGIVSFFGDIVAGKAVSAGQAIFSVSSKGLEQADPAAAISVDVAVAKRALSRAESLFKDNLITRTEYESKLADYERAVAASASVGARTARAVGIAAPISGFIVNVAVSPGQFVEMGQTLAVVAADRRLLLRADVSERNRNFIGHIAEANIYIPSSGNSISLAALNPKILTAGATLAGNSHYIPVYIEFDNPGALGNGSVVEAWLLGPARHDVIAVPRAALVEEGGYFYVYVRNPIDRVHHDDDDDDDDGDHDDHTGHNDADDRPHCIFEKREVTIGASDGEKFEITSGIHPGEDVVISGAQRIRMAGMGSSIQGHSHHH